MHTDQNLGPGYHWLAVAERVDQAPVVWVEDHLALPTWTTTARARRRGWRRRWSVTRKGTKMEADVGTSAQAGRSGLQGYSRNMRICK